MAETYLGSNIRRLREERGTTQEQMARALNISFQAVSKWETDTTVPDTLMLPRIAAFLEVTIDELFRPEKRAYDNNAQKLLAVYEASHDRDDFIRAEAEFRKLFEKGGYSRDDVRLYGVLYEYQMYYCRDMALEQYGKVLASPERDETYMRTRSQRIYLLSQIGRSAQALEEERARAQAEPGAPGNCLALMTALYLGGKYQEVLEKFQAELSKTGGPEAGVWLVAGDACGKLGRYEQAQEKWQRALELDPEHIDGLYSMAYSFHERGDFSREAQTWERIVDWYAHRGYVYELTYPQERLRRARELSGQS